MFLSDVEAAIGGFAIVAEQAGDLAGASVSGGTDFNQDGVADQVIGTPHNSEGGYDAGAVYLVWGGAGEVVDLSLVAQGTGGAKIVGTYGSLTEAAVAVNGDMNGDGRADLNICGTQSDDLMTAGYGGTRKIDDTANSIYAFDGNDALAAGDGNDVLFGGEGADLLTGGAGNDVFMYQKLQEGPSAGRDTITGLSSTDIIDLSRIDANVHVAGNQAFQQVLAFTGHEAEMVLTYDAGTNQTFLMADANGDTIADFALNILGNHTAPTGWLL